MATNLLCIGHMIFYRVLPLLCVLALFCVLLFNADSYCSVPNLFATSWSVPLNDCKYCAGIAQPTVFHDQDNVTVSYFMNNFAFSSGPVVFKNATHDWPATGKISYKFLRDLYSNNCNQSAEKDANTEQYFTYKNSVLTKEEFLSQSEAESNNGSWYISWLVVDGA